MPGKNVAANKTGEIIQKTPVQRFIGMLSIEAELENKESNAAFIEALMNEMVEATTFDEAIAAQESNKILSGKDLAERNAEVEVREFTVVKSSDEYDSPLGHYIRFDDVIDLATLQPVVAATGAPNVVIPFWKARNNQELPIQVQFYLDGRVVKVRRIPKRPIEVAPQF
jgi:hypothetical protein